MERFTIGGGVAPTVMDNHGETITIAEPMVVAQRGREPNVMTQTRTEEGKRLRKDYEAHKITKQRKYMQQYEARTDGVTNTLTSVQKDNLVVEPMASVHPLSHALEFKAESLSDVTPCLRATEAKAVTCAWEPSEEVRRVAEEVRHQPCGVTVDNENNLRPYRQDKAKSGVAELQTEYAESVGSTLTSARPNNVYGDCNPPFRIRRLIPRECFRLMDVSDEDYDKINTYIRGCRKNGTPIKISESQQYKLAGNSIVVACMYYIFESLFFPADNEITEPKQLDIFDIIE